MSIEIKMILKKREIKAKKTPISPLSSHNLPWMNNGVHAELMVMLFNTLMGNFLVQKKNVTPLIVLFNS